MQQWRRHRTKKGGGSNFPRGGSPSEKKIGIPSSFPRELNTAEMKLIVWHGYVVGTGKEKLTSFHVHLATQNSTD